MASPVLLWHRNDLRLDDNLALAKALESGGPIVAVYCFDPRWFGTTPFGFPKTGGFRARFLVECVEDLRAGYEAAGCGLVVRVGKPEEMLPELARLVRAKLVVSSKEATSEEAAVEAAVRTALEADGASLSLVWQSTLHLREDLPFRSIAELPDIFTQYRKRVERDASIRTPLDPPPTLPALPPGVEPGAIPRPEDLGAPEARQSGKGVLPFRGGESKAIARLDDYFWKGDHLRAYKETRNGLLGADYSSKFSPWLAAGCISPRRIAAEIRRYEASRVANSSTYWMLFELMWRDFFRFTALKVGSKMFKAGGMKGQPPRARGGKAEFAAWAEGRTGVPFVDANMRELAATGFMSNRGRQNAASFLVRDLGVDWRRGAEWFESLLLDYDPCSNWGNWNYVAGIGNDPREDRYFHVVKQARNYDPQGDFVRHWLPEMARVPGGRVHEPWLLSDREQRDFGVRLGVDYPNPLARPKERRS